MRIPNLAAILLVVQPIVVFAGERQVEKWEGIDCFVTRDAKQPGRPIIELDFIGCDLKDVDLKKLATVKQTLKSLNLRYNLKVTDAGLKELACLENLETLYFPVTKIGDAGLKQLKTLKRLKSIGLMHSYVTDVGVDELVTHADLESIDLTGTKVTKAAVAKLQKALPKCKVFYP